MARLYELNRASDSITVLSPHGWRYESPLAHASQAAADDGADRTLALFLQIPRPIYDVVFGTEWFRDPAHTGPVSDDIFAGLA